MEGIERGAFAVIDLEDRQQLGHLQQVPYPLGETGQLNRAASVARRGVQRHQRAQATAIDVINAAQVQNDLLAFRQQRFDGVAQFGRFLAKNDAAIAIYHRDVVHHAPMDFQLHGILLRPKPI